MLYAHRGNVCPSIVPGTRVVPGTRMMNTMNAIYVPQQMPVTHLYNYQMNPTSPYQMAPPPQQHMPMQMQSAHMQSPEMMQAHVPDQEQLGTVYFSSTNHPIAPQKSVYYDQMQQIDRNAALMHRPKSAIPIVNPVQVCLRYSGFFYLLDFPHC